MRGQTSQSVSKQGNPSGEIPQMPTRKVTRQGSSYEQNTANIGKSPKRAAHGKPSRRMAGRVQQPTRAPNPVVKMTALSMPHNPVMGARTLIEVFDVEYLRALVIELSNHLKGLEE